MGDYYGVNRSDEYLEHWGIAKGGQRANHKYIMRVKSGSGWRYLYTPAEVAAYGKERIGGLGKGIGSAAAKAGRFARHYAKKGLAGTASELARGARKTISGVGRRIAGSYAVRRVTGLFENPLANRQKHTKASSEGGQSAKIADRQARTKTRIEKFTGKSSTPYNTSYWTKKSPRNGSKGEAMSAAGDYSGKGKGSSKTLGARIGRALTKSNAKTYGRRAGNLNTAGQSRDERRKTARTTGIRRNRNAPSNGAPSRGGRDITTAKYRAPSGSSQDYMTAKYGGGLAGADVRKVKSGGYTKAAGRYLKSLVKEELRSSSRRHKK